MELTSTNQSVSGIWKVTSPGHSARLFRGHLQRQSREEAAVNVSVYFVGMCNQIYPAITCHNNTELYQLGSSVYIIENYSSSCQAFEQAIDGKNVTDHLVLGSMAGLVSSGFVPYWGVSDLSPHKSHVLEITQSDARFPTEQDLIRGNEPIVFYLDAIV